MNTKMTVVIKEDFFAEPYMRLDNKNNVNIMPTIKALEPFFRNEMTKFKIIGSSIRMYYQFCNHAIDICKIDDYVSAIEDEISIPHSEWNKASDEARLSSYLQAQKKVLDTEAPLQYYAFEFEIRTNGSGDGYSLLVRKDLSLGAPTFDERANNEPNVDINLTDLSADEVFYKLYAALETVLGTKA